MFHKKDPRGDLGKWAEKQATKWLDARSAAHSDFAYHRYPDARAARGALTSQPADFIVALIHKGQAKGLHLEVKETAQERRLPKSKVSQYGALLKFHWAGFHTLLLIYRSKFNDWTYLTGPELFKEEVAPASFPFVEGRSFPTHDALLNYLFDAS